MNKFGLNAGCAADFLLGAEYLIMNKGDEASLTERAVCRGTQISKVQ